MSKYIGLVESAEAEIHAHAHTQINSRDIYLSYDGIPPPASARESQTLIDPDWSTDGLGKQPVVSRLFCLFMQNKLVLCSNVYFFPNIGLCFGGVAILFVYFSPFWVVLAFF